MKQQKVDKERQNKQIHTRILIQKHTMKGQRQLNSSGNWIGFRNISKADKLKIRKADEESLSGKLGKLVEVVVNMEVDKEVDSKVNKKVNKEVHFCSSSAPLSVSSHKFFWPDTTCSTPPPPQIPINSQSQLQHFFHPLSLSCLGCLSSDKSFANS